ncbi:cation diffusion facilitator family transporter [Clostridium sp. KNHs205]|uniref:cation diffusion facilitator family transporter n=1 Tax=Clostridium sp. KNHs205 TaxID=1449050 RepID=UPI00051B58E9|nr:cation diffusion facilitator family transporter [Clostridium sp. KNHs205]
MEKNKFKRVQRCLFLILLINWLVALLKILIGAISRSTSVTADGLHSLSDGMSNIVGLIGTGMAAKPEDREHPYGHNKYETLSGLFIAVMLFWVGLRVLINAIQVLRNPIKPEISLLSLLVLFLTLVINFFVSMGEYREGRKLGSLILISDSIHTRSDIYISLGVLFTAVGIKLGLPNIIDPILSLIVSGFILYSAYEVGKNNCNILLDRVVVDTEEIRKIVMSFEEVKDTHKIRSRGSIENLYIDMHILVEPCLNILETHKLVHEIENAIRSHMNQSAQVNVHLEPYIAENTY